MIIDKYHLGKDIRCKVVCDECRKSFERYWGSVVRSRKVNENKDYCVSCSAKHHLKPQNSKEYWEDPDIKKQHSEALKASEAFHKALSQRNTSGVNNGMYGKHLSVESRAKMSASRKGKIGSKATAWKGGKTSLNNRVKLYIARSGWYKKVFERDSWKCRECGSSKKLDGHHIKAISIIIKEFLKEKESLTTDDEKYLYLISQEEILDLELKNGITLCRVCHGKSHGRKWGSHDQSR